MLTTSLSMLAESNIQLAAAITKIADKDERRLSVEEKLTTLLSTVISKLNLTSFVILLYFQLQRIDRYKLYFVLFYNITIQ